MFGNRILRTFAAISLSLAAFPACSEQRVTTPELEAPPATAFSIADQSVPQEITNRYIVLFDRDVGPPRPIIADLVAQSGGYVFHIYENVVKGFAVANLSDEGFGFLRNSPYVRLIEEDGQSPQVGSQTVSSSGSWGLDRIDQRQNGSRDNVYSYPSSGSGTHIYILDTGIRSDHADFSGRLGNGHTELMFSSGADPYIDQDGHGTHVASLAAGTTYGVAKGATLHSVRINDNGNAYHSDMVAGLDWIAQNHQSPAVANLSYGADAQSVKDAMSGMASAGVTMVKAAGNDNADACFDDGNQALTTIVVGATTVSDAKASYSNYGSCVDLFAPGSNLSMAAHDGTTTNSYLDSGTSYAAPIVAGIAAIYRGQYTSDSPGIVYDVVIGGATPGAISGLSSSSPNQLAYVGLPGPLSVDIDGYAVIHPNDFCSWSAKPTGGRGGYTYSWSGIGSGSGPNINFNPSSSGSLVVDVWDANGTHASTSFWITEDSGIQQICPE